MTLLRLQYWEDSIVSLWCGMDSSSNIENDPPTVLHASFLVLIKVCINYKPSVPNQFITLGTLSSSVHLFNFEVCS